MYRGFVDCCKERGGRERERARAFVQCLLLDGVLDVVLGALPMLHVETCHGLPMARLPLPSCAVGIL